MNNPTRTICVIYGILLIAGGAMGYVKAHSTMSLYLGLISGILVFLSIIATVKNPDDVYLYLAGISLFLAYFFLFRFKVSFFKFIPAGLMLLASTSVYVVAGVSYLENKRKSKAS